jgi:hypothetical protein
MTLQLTKVVEVLDLQIEGKVIALAIIGLCAFRLDVHRWRSSSSAVSAVSSQPDVDAVFIDVDARYCNRQQPRPP